MHPVRSRDLIAGHEARTRPQVAAVAMPFVVWLVDQHGRRPLGCVLATAGLVTVYAALLLRPDAVSLVLPLIAALGAACAP